MAFDVTSEAKTKLSLDYKEFKQGVEGVLKGLGLVDQSIKDVGESSKKTAAATTTMFKLEAFREIKQQVLDIARSLAEGVKWLAKYSPEAKKVIESFAQLESHIGRTIAAHRGAQRAFSDFDKSLRASKSTWGEWAGAVVSAWGSVTDAIAKGILFVTNFQWAAGQIKKEYAPPTEVQRARTPGQLLKWFEEHQQSWLKAGAWVPGAEHVFGEEEIGEEDIITGMMRRSLGGRGGAPSGATDIDIMEKAFEDMRERQEVLALLQSEMGAAAPSAAAMAAAGAGAAWEAAEIDFGPLDRLIDTMDILVERSREFKETLIGAFTGVLTGGLDTVAALITDLASGTMSAAEAFKKFGATMVSSLGEAIFALGRQALIQAIMASAYTLLQAFNPAAAAAILYGVAALAMVTGAGLMAAGSAMGRGGGGGVTEAPSGAAPPSEAAPVAPSAITVIVEGNVIGKQEELGLLVADALQTVRLKGYLPAEA